MGNTFCKIKNKNCALGQSTLELTVALIVIFILVGAITNIWLWSNKQLVDRQRWYQGTRKIAGFSNDFYIKPVWKDGIVSFYKLDDLKEEDVLIQRN